MAKQLPLDFRLRDETTLSRFVSGDNQELLDILSNFSQPAMARNIYLYGEKGTGKTHLLQATSRISANSFYLPLKEVLPLQPGIFDGMENFNLLCIDDIELIAGQRELEVALFDLFNRIQEKKHSLLIAATQLPGLVNFELKDLVSRFNACISYRVMELDDQQKRQFLTSDAKSRGMHISEEVVEWIFTRIPRDMPTLSALLDRMDRESLSQHRRITIPFLKNLIQ